MLKYCQMRLLVAASLFALAAVAQDFPQAVDLVQRIDQLYPWLQVAAFDVDAQGDIYLAGSALGPIPDVLTTRFGPLGGRDIIVIKLDPTAQRMVYGAAIGGSSDDLVGGIKVDASGNTYLIVNTTSDDFPIGLRQGSRSGGPIVVKLNPTGTLSSSTLLSWALTIEGFNVDSAGTVYLGGTAARDDLPTSPTSYRPSPPDSLVVSFIAKLDHTGRTLEAATYADGPISNVLRRANGDVLFSGGAGIGALNSSLSQRLFLTDTKIEPFFTGTPTGSVGIGQDGLGNIYVAGPKALRKYAPDGQHLMFSRKFPTAFFSRFAVTHSGLVYLFGSVPPNFPTRNATQPCAPELPSSISGVSDGRTQVMMVVGPDGETRYATYMAEPISFELSVSIGDGRLYALAQATLTQDSSNWKGIVRLNPDEIPGNHTSAACLTHAATLHATVIAPGTIMALFGDHLGPEEGVAFALQDGHVPFNLAGTSLTVDGKPAPILYAQNSQINFVVPWSLRTDGLTVAVCATFGSDTSCLNPQTYSIDPGFFFTATNVIAAINQEGTINSQEHPAKPGSYVSVYLTGGGTMDGTVTDGGIAGLDLRRFTAAVSARFSFKCLPDCFDLAPADAPVLFAGAVPTLVYGANVAILRVPSPPATAINAQLTLYLRQPGRTVDSTASGYLFVKP